MAKAELGVMRRCLNCETPFLESKSLAERLSQVCRPFASRGDRAFAAAASDDTLGRSQEARASRIRS